MVPMPRRPRPRRNGDPFAGLDDLPPPASRDHGNPKPVRPHRYTVGPGSPEVGPDVHPYDAYARSWLRTMYALDVLLGVRRPGDRRRWAYRGFKSEAVSKFLGSLKAKH